MALGYPDPDEKVNGFTPERIGVEEFVTFVEGLVPDLGLAPPDLRDLRLAAADGVARAGQEHLHRVGSTERLKVAVRSALNEEHETRRSRRPAAARRRGVL